MIAGEEQQYLNIFGLVSFTSLVSRSNRPSNSGDDLQHSRGSFRATPVASTGWPSAMGKDLLQAVF